MALDMVVDSLDAVPEAHRDQYEPRDGKFQLQVNGAFSPIDRDKLQGSLASERDAHKATRSKVAAFGEWDPDKIAVLDEQNTQRGLDLEALGSESDPEKVEKALEAKVAARMGPIDRELKQLRKDKIDLTTTNEGLVSSASRSKIRRKVLSAFADKKLGANQQAVEDVEAWAEKTFELDDSGKPVTRDKIGVTPGLSPEEQLKDMRTAGQRPLWFGKTVSAGAREGGDSKLAGEDPFKPAGSKKGPGNMTKCTALFKSDPERAQALCKAANMQRFFPSLFLNN